MVTIHEQCELATQPSEGLISIKKRETEKGVSVPKLEKEEAEEEEEGKEGR